MVNKGLPKKKKAKYPHRITLRISDDIKEIFDKLKKSDSLDVPEITRQAIKDYFKKNNLEGFFDGEGD